MTRSIPTFALAAAACLAAATPARAQSAVGHQGFHLSIGLGSGSVATTCNDCSDSRTNDGAAMLRIGGAVSPGVVLSGELTGWAHKDGPATTRVGWMNFVTQIYPDPTTGLYLLGGIGMGRVTADVDRGALGSSRLVTTGPGLEAGAGYDIHLSPTFSLTPYVSYLYQAQGQANINGANTTEELGANMLHIGLAASWR